MGGNLLEAARVLLRLGKAGLHPQDSVTLSRASDEGRAEQPV